MIKKLITERNDAREKLYKGIEILADAVGSTLGAKGQTVLYQFGDEPGGVPLVTKDGVTVANQIFLDDPVENLGAQLIKESAKNTVKRAGDGTTTSTVLTHSILKLAGNNDDIDFVRGMDDAKNKIVQYLDDNAIEVDLELQKFVAKVSTNNDEFLAGLISEAVEKAGENGTVTWKLNDEATRTEVEVEDGAIIPAGIIDPGFINVAGQQQMAYDNPLVFVSSMKIQDIEQLKPVTKMALENHPGRPLVYIADFEPRVASQILMNVHKNKMQLGVIRTPSFGPLRQEMLEDICDLLGCTLHGGHLGDDMDALDKSFLGSCASLFADGASTVLKFDKKPDLSEKVEAIKTQIDSDETSMRKGQLKERLAMLAGAIGTIKIWAPSEIELKELHDRTEDAVLAVYAAKDGGILPGGGVALRNASTFCKKKKGDDMYANGWNCLLEAVHAPFEKILSNAQMEVPGILSEGMGINVLNGKTVNMIKSGIIDPAKVTKQALINAVSVAKTILSTNVVINNIEK